MELNNKEKKVQQVLSDIHYDIDTDFLWKEVSSELDKKKKRKFLWFIPFGLLTAFAVAYLFSYYDISPSNKISGNTPVEIPVDNNQTTTTEFISNSNGNTSTIIEEDESSQTTKERTKESRITSENILNQKSSSINFQNLGQITTNKFTPSIKNYLSQSNNIEISENIKLNKLDQKTSNTNTKVTEKLSQLLSLNALASLPFSKFTHTREMEKISSENFDPIEISKMESNRYFLTLGMGAIKNITTSNTINGEFFNEYFDKEIQLPAVNASLLMGIQTKNNWRFFGGFDYAQLITRYKNTDTELVINSTPIESQQSISSSGNYETTEGNLITTTQTDNDITWHKRHYQYNLQVGVSKDLFAKSNFSMMPEFSLIQNIQTRHKGYYFIEEAPHLLKFTEREENPYRKNTGLNTQLALNLAYQLKGLEFSINTAWRNPLNAITNESNFYQTKNSQLSIQARINYLLNWENK